MRRAERKSEGRRNKNKEAKDQGPGKDKKGVRVRCRTGLQKSEFKSLFSPEAQEVTCRQSLSLSLHRLVVSQKRENSGCATLKTGRIQENKEKSSGD